MVSKGQRYPFERFVPRRRYTLFDYIDNSNIMCISDTNSQFNIWRIQLSKDNNGQYYTQKLTNFIHKSVRHAFCSQKDSSIILFADDKGNENFQIYRIADAYSPSQGRRGCYM